VASFDVGVQLYPQHTSIDALRNAWQAADRLGVDSVWTWDHFFPITGDSDGSHFEGWSLLAAMAVDTQRARLGVLVTCHAYRNPDLLADMAHTVDHLSGGRVILGLGAGWFERDHTEYGYHFDPPAVRLQALEKSLLRIRHRLEALGPGPRGPIPLLIGGGGEKVTLRLVAEHAQLWNMGGPPEQFEAKSRVLDDWCRRVGRDPAEITRTVVLPHAGGLAHIDRYLEAGASHLIVGRPHPFDLEPVAELLGRARGAEKGAPKNAVRRLVETSNVGLNRCVHVAAALGVADVLADGPRHVDEIAAATGAHAPSLYRIMRALATEGVFSEAEPRHFGLTAVSEVLRSDRGDSLRPAFVDHPRRWAAWGEILHTARTGQTAFEKANGMTYFEWLSTDPAGSSWFNDNMASAGAVNQAVIDAYDFSTAATVADIGGGTGRFLAQVLAAHPSLRGVLFDLPEVVGNSRLESAGVSERCQVVPGSFFDSVPEGADVYVLARVLHDWDDAEALAILEGVRRASVEGGRVVVVEMVVPDDGSPHPGKWFDVLMMVMTGGRERTRPEFEELFDGAGFRLAEVFPTRSPLSVIEAIAV